jgi:hypothetical protein
MKTSLPACLLALLLGAGGASAATGLSDAQMDQISAGALDLVPTGCGGASNCSSVSATSTSSVSTVTDPTSGQLQTVANVINKIICGSGCNLSSTRPPGAPSVPPTNTTNTVGNGTSNPTVPGAAAGTVVSINGLNNL